MKQILAIAFIACFVLIQCAIDEPKLVYSYARSIDFEQEVIEDPGTAEDLGLKLWAPGPLLRNVVSLTFDDTGVMYVSETSRRKSSYLDIRAHPSWMTETLGLTTLEETEAFHLQKLDPTFSNQNIWLEDFDQNGSHDYRDLMVQSERVRRIEDTDNDGKADRSSIFAESFHDLLTGVAAGIMVLDEDVYLSVAPDLWKLVDIDRDGRMDHKQSISHGYGIHIAYAGHDMSGIIMGPDGRLYWSIGDIGINTVDQKGKRWRYPHEGAVMRCNPDGSEFEVFAHGLRNPQELAFNKYGDLFTVDNDGDHPGEHERYVHVIEGSDAGWRIHWQYGKYNLPNESYKVWTKDSLHKPHFPGQAAYIVPPIAEAPNGPCGLVFNPGLGWGESWSEAFIASYFTGSSANSKVEAFWMEPAGSSYRLKTTQEVITGIVPTGIEFSPAGGLFVADWKDSYDKKPSGRIWKVNTSNPSLLAEQQEVYTIINSTWDDKDLDLLMQYLGHSDMRIRLKAQFELVSRNASDSFERVIEQGGEELSIIHAIWGLGQLGRTQNYDCNKLVLPLKEHRSEIRAQAAKVLGENRTRSALSELIICLEDPSLKVVRHAVEAMGKLGDNSAFEPMIKYLEHHEEIDPHLRHTFALAVSRLERAEDLCVNLSQHHSDQVRMIGVLALRHLLSRNITAFINDTDPHILNEVARAIHDDESIFESLGVLAATLDHPSVRDEVFLRRAINANLRMGLNEGFNRLKAFALDSGNSQDMRREALRSMSYWNQPPILDRVEGRYRKLDKRPVIDAKTELLELLNAPSIRNNTDLWDLAIQAVGDLGIRALENELLEIITDGNHPYQIYVSSLRALSAISSDRLREGILELLSKSDEQVQLGILELLQSADLEESPVAEILGKLVTSEEIRVKQKATLAMSTVSSSHDLLLVKVRDLVQGDLEKELILETMAAARRSQSEAINSLLDEYFDQMDTTILMNKYGPALYGGDPDKGYELFHKNPTMTCTQCHTLDKTKGLVGPGLSDIGSRLSREQLLQSLLEPGNRIAPGYGSASVQIKDGSQMTGTIVEDSDSMLVLFNEKAGKVTIDKSETVEIKKSPSAMISVEGYLNIWEVRDIIAFLASLKG